MDQARQIAVNALENNPASWTDKWYLKIVTHALAFGLGMVLERYRLEPRILKLEKALQEIGKLWLYYYPNICHFQN